MNGTNSIVETVKNYMGQSGMGMLFLASLLVLLGYHMQQKETKDKKVLIWVMVLSVVLVFNSVSMKILGKFTDSATFYRFLWMVPVIFVISYVMVNCFSRMKGFVGKAVMAGICVLMLVFVGNGYVTKDTVKYPGSMEKIPQDVKSICQIIEENKTVDNPVCAFDLATQLMVRTENPSIVWAVGRKPYLHFQQYGYDNGSNKYLYSQNLLKVVDSGIQIERKKLRKTLKKKNVEFLVMKKSYQMDEYLKEVGLNPVGESDNYIIYQYINKDKE